MYTPTQWQDSLFSENLIFIKKKKKWPHILFIFLKEKKKKKKTLEMTLNLEKCIFKNPSLSLEVKLPIEKVPKW